MRQRFPLFLVSVTSIDLRLAAVGAAGVVVVTHRLDIASVHALGALLAGQL